MIGAPWSSEIPMVHYGNQSQPNYLFDLRSLEVIALFYSKDAEFYLKTYSLFSL